MANKSGNKNLIIGALVVVALVLGGLLYKNSQDKKGISIEVSEDGITMEEN